jgi:acetyl esterase/lipase
VSAAVGFLSRLLFAAASVLAFLTLWIILPGPTRPLLVLAVGAPELSAWLLLGSLVLGALTIGLATPDGWTRAALVLTAIAAALAMSPLVRVPFAVRDCDRAMREALGDDYLREVPADRRAQMRSAPVVALDLFRGVDTGRAAHPVRVTRDVPFAEPEGVPLTLDIYSPGAAATPTTTTSTSASPSVSASGSGSASASASGLASGSASAATSESAPALYPIVVQIYGGAWQRGRPGDDAHFATYLAAHGFVVFAIDYRHAPQWQWPAHRADVQTALAWIATHARAYDADVSRLALIGRSAGAHLALLAAYQPAPPPIQIRAVVSYYGPIDLADGYRNPPVPDPLDARAIEEAFLGGTPDRVPERYREASPITYVPSPSPSAASPPSPPSPSSPSSPSSPPSLRSPTDGQAIKHADAIRLPPSLLIYGGRDHVVLARYGAMLDARLRAAGATSILLKLPWAEHAFDAITNGPSGQLSLYYTERFLAWSLLRPTSH